MSLAVNSHLAAPNQGSFNIEAYLERINYHGSLAVTSETLRALQQAHLLTVPFENLSIHAGEEIVLADQALFAKIVERRRGGFCYELNGLFTALLRALGFEVAMLSAAVVNAAGELGPDFDHMTLLVTLAERWLVDVGFGESFREPLLVDARTEQIQGDRLTGSLRTKRTWYLNNVLLKRYGKRSIVSLCNRSSIPTLAGCAFTIKPRQSLTSLKGAFAREPPRKAG